MSTRVADSLRRIGAEGKHMTDKVGGAKQSTIDKGQEKIIGEHRIAVGKSHEATEQHGTVEKRNSSASVELKVFMIYDKKQIQELTRKCLPQIVEWRWKLGHMPAIQRTNRMGVIAWKENLTMV